MAIPVCDTCKLVHEAGDLYPCIRAQAEAMAKLLAAIGDRGECRGCGQTIWWVLHRNGKRAPYTAAGLNHFVDCPVAKEFKR